MKSRSLTSSNENEPPDDDTTKKSEQTARKLLSSSSDDSSERLRPLRTSRENNAVPAAATEPETVTFRPLSYEERFRLLKELTLSVVEGMEHAPPTEVHPRYPDVPCYQETRVRYEDTGIARPLHANHVKIHDCHVICTQAPTQPSIVEFWKTARDCDALILDLCNQSDRGLINAYYPESSQFPFVAGDLTISLLCRDNVSNDKNIDFTKNRYLVKIGDQQCELERLNYSSWNDLMNVPIKELYHIVETVHKNLKGRKLITHCRAGVGRTGTFTIVWTCYLLHLEGKLKEIVKMYGGPEETIKHIVILGRAQRGPLFVNTPVQYASCNEFLVDLLNKPAP